MKTKPLATTPLEEEEEEEEGFLHKTNRVPNPNQVRDNIWEVVDPTEEFSLNGDKF
jgi:hypothetical protein